MKVRKEAVWAMFADACKQCVIELDDDCYEDFDLLDEAVQEIARSLSGGK